MQVVICDNGIGIKKSKLRGIKKNHVSIGIDLTKKRLEMFSKTYKTDCYYTVEEYQPSEEFPGTKVTITLPYHITD